MPNKYTRSSALKRLQELRDMLDDQDANVEEIEAEIAQIEEALENLVDAAEDLANGGQQEERADEEGEEEGGQEGEQQEEDAEQRTSTARQRAQLRARVAAGIAGVQTRNFRNMEGSNMPNTIEINSPEYRSAWLRDLQGKPISAQERTALAGGNYVIPQETINKIWGKMELYPLLNAIDVMHIPGTVVLPVEGTVNDANVVAMGTAATDSADTVAQVSLGIYKIIKTIEITADVAAMAVPAFETWLVDRLSNKMFRKITALVAAGTGTSQPTGLTSISATGQTYTKAAITYADILAIIATPSSEWLPNASFVMSRATFFQGVLGLEDTHKKPIVVADVQAPMKYNILGFPVIIEDAVGTDIIFGDLKEGYAFNFGQDITIARDESVGFRIGSTCFRGMALGDGKPTGVGLVRFTKAAA